MMADKELWSGRWLVHREAARERAGGPAAKSRRRKHAGWVLELTLMLVLSLLLPNPRKRK